MHTENNGLGTICIPTTILINYNFCKYFLKTPSCNLIELHCKNSLQQSVVNSYCMYACKDICTNTEDGCMHNDSV